MGTPRLRSNNISSKHTPSNKTQIQNQPSQTQRIRHQRCKQQTNTNNWDNNTHPNIRQQTNNNTNPHKPKSTTPRTDNRMERNDATRNHSPPLPKPLPTRRTMLQQ